MNKPLRTIADLSARADNALDQAKENLRAAERSMQRVNAILTIEQFAPKHFDDDGLELPHLDDPRINDLDSEPIDFDEAPF